MVLRTTTNHERSVKGLLKTKGLRLLSRISHTPAPKRRVRVYPLGSRTRGISNIPPIPPFPIRSGRDGGIRRSVRRHPAMSRSGRHDKTRLSRGSTILPVGRYGIYGLANGPLGRNPHPLRSEHEVCATIQALLFAVTWSLPRPCKIGSTS